MDFWEPLLIVLSTATADTDVEWLQDTDPDTGVFGKAMKAVAITLIFRIAGGIIRNENPLPNLAKFQREMQAVETFDFPILLELKNTPHLRNGDRPVSKLEESSSSDKCATTPTCS